MVREINPTETGRAAAWALWIPPPNPMVTLLKTLDVTNLVRVSKRKKLFRYFLPISFQFHHTQMDGAHAERFLENLQNEIRDL